MLFRHSSQRRARSGVSDQPGRGSGGVDPSNRSRGPREGLTPHDSLAARDGGGSTPAPGVGGAETEGSTPAPGVGGAETEGSTPAPGAGGAETEGSTPAPGAG